MDCFEFKSLVQVNAPHHTHSRLLGSYVLEYKTLQVPPPDRLFEEFKELILDACKRIDGGQSDLLRISLKSEAKDPIDVHSYYHEKSSIEFIEEIEKFARRVDKICQSTRCFEVGKTVQVLIDRISLRDDAGSSCTNNSYVEFKCVNEYTPVDGDDTPEKFIKLPLKSSILNVKLITYASDNDCLFISLLTEIIRKRKAGRWGNAYDPGGECGRFPFGLCHHNLIQWIRQIKAGKLTQKIPQLESAGRAFARLIGFSHLLGRPLTSKNFIDVCNSLISCKLRFILYDPALNPIAWTSNCEDDSVKLMLRDNHFHVIHSIRSKGRKLCRFCLYYHNEKHVHNCHKICHMCKTAECLTIGIQSTDLKCDNCKIYFRNPHCQSIHVCVKSRKCKYCARLLVNRDGIAHICRYFCCRVCGAVDECTDHKCSFTAAPRHERVKIYHETERLSKNQPIEYDMRQEEERITKESQENPFPQFKGKKKTILIYYDIETAIMSPEDTQAMYPLNKQANILVPVVVCAQAECNGCVNGHTNCDCEQMRWTFVSTHNENCMKSFITALMTYMHDEGNYSYKLIAHNGGRFDHHFLLREIATYGPTPELFIKRGSTIVGIRLGNKTILDSYKFIQTSLRAMPKAIGADVSVSKDYFPHDLTSWKTLAEGLEALPDKSSFGYDSMCDSDKHEFDEWYAKQPRGHYNFKDIMIDYCMKDVEVLRLCCRKFICNWSLRFGFNPFDTYTLPSTVIQSMIVKSKLAPLIPLTPYHGYNKAKTESKIARAFITFLGRKMNINFRAGAKLNPRFYPDGYTETPRKIAVDFLGCYYHLCDECGYNTQRDNYTTKSTFISADGEKKTVNEPISKSVEEQKRLMKRLFCEENDIEYIEVWEHQIKELTHDERQQLDEIYKQIDHQSVDQGQIIHRDALFGGRTEAFKLFHECGDDEVIEYHDVNGLYPFVLMNGRFPMMDPEFFYRIDDAERFIRDLSSDRHVKKAALCKAIVLAPQDLLLPVLPCRVNGKLKFGLCRKCMEHSTTECTHNECERAIEGTWTSFELELAMENGYEVPYIIQAEVYELCAGPTDPGLPNPHREFIGKCMAAKDYAEMTGNKSARFLAKLAANTYWGAMAKNSDNLSTQFFTTVDDFYKFLNNESIKVKDLHSLGTKLKLTYRTLKEMIETPKQTSLITAIFVTSQARIKLYNYMKMLGAERVIYCDTDSVLWVRNKHYNVPFAVGKECGQMSNEIAKDYPNCFIKRFVSLGPKSYAYEVHNDSGLVSSAMRMKGISFNGINKGRSFTFEDMRALLMGEKDGISIGQKKFAISSRFHTLHEEEKAKNVRVTMDKRIVHEDFTTQPYGMRRAGRTKRSRV